MIVRDLQAIHRPSRCARVRNNCRCRSLSKRKFKKCALRISGVMGGTFLTLLSAAEVIEKKMTFLPLGAWLIGGPIISGWWAYEFFCNGGDDEQE